MSYNQLMNIYSFVCSQKDNGVTVGTLMEKYKLKKKDIIKFLSILQEYNENVAFYYYSPKEEEFIDDLKEVKEDTIIEVDDDFKNLTLKLDFEDSVKLYEAIEEWIGNEAVKEKFLSSIGGIDAESFSYITKGVQKYDLNTSIADNKNTLIECILNNNTVTFTCSGTKYKVNPLGIRYNSIKDSFLLVASCSGELKEYDIACIERKSIKYTGEYFNEDFNMDKYLKQRHQSLLRLQVFPEANVLEKLKGIFNETQFLIENKGDYSILEARVTNANEFKDIINSFGMSVIVLEPETLRNAIISDTVKVLQRYERK